MRFFALGLDLHWYFTSAWNPIIWQSMVPQYTDSWLLNTLVTTADDADPWQERVLNHWATTLPKKVHFETNIYRVAPPRSLNSRNLKCRFHVLRYIKLKSIFYLWQQIQNLILITSETFFRLFYIKPLGIEVNKTCKYWWFLL